MTSMEMRKGLQALMVGTMGIMKATLTSLVVVLGTATSPLDRMDGEWVGSIIPILSRSPLVVTLMVVVVHLILASTTFSPIFLVVTPNVGATLGVSAVHPALMLVPLLLEVYRTSTLRLSRRK